MYFLFIFFCLVAILLALIVYARWYYGSLEKQGITVIKPEHFLLGSAMLTYRKPGGLLDIENMKKYGKVWGLYEGREPQIFICDVELIRKITTKDADHFDSKRLLDFGDPLFNEFLDFQPKQKWKLLRDMLTPAVSSSMKLRNSNPAMREAIYAYIKEIKQQMNGKGKVEKLSVNDSIFSMLIDLTARSQYAIDIKKSGASNRFAQLLRDVMTSPANESPLIATYAYAFPFIKSLLPNTLINPGPSKELCNIIRQFIEIRKQQRAAGEGPSAKDYLDSVIEWHANLGSEDYKRGDITEMSIFGLGITIFIAGQDQFSLILGVLLYYISENAEIEKKVQEEVDKVFLKCGGILDHESLYDLTYLTSCITEAARLYPFFYRSERVCTKDWSDPESGIQVKKGNVIQIPIWAMHRNPDYYENPEEFKPERFLPGNKERIHPYAFASFGFGPRNCAGKKYSMEVMTLLAAHLVKELRFIKRNDTCLEFIPVGPFFGVCNPIYLDVESRNVLKPGQ